MLALQAPTIQRRERRQRVSASLHHLAISSLILALMLLTKMTSATLDISVNSAHTLPRQIQVMILILTVMLEQSMIRTLSHLTCSIRTLETPVVKAIIALRALPWKFHAHQAMSVDLALRVSSTLPTSIPTVLRSTNVRMAITASKVLPWRQCKRHLVQLATIVQQASMLSHFPALLVPTIRTLPLFSTQSQNVPTAQLTTTAPMLHKLLSTQ